MYVFMYTKFQIQVPHSTKPYTMTAARRLKSILINQLATFTAPQLLSNSFSWYQCSSHKVIHSHKTMLVLQVKALATCI